MMTAFFTEVAPVDEFVSQICKNDALRLQYITFGQPIAEGYDGGIALWDCLIN